MNTEQKRYVVIVVIVSLITVCMYYWVRGERIFGANFIPGIGEPSMTEDPGTLPHLSISSGHGRAMVDPPGNLPDYRPTLTRGHYSTQV